MNITYNTPTPKTKTFNDVENGEVFRFPDCKTPCMKVNFDGNEVLQAYHYYYDMDDVIDECLIVHQEEVYVWNSDQTQLDYDHYLQSKALQNLRAYVCLDTGKVYVSHKDEEVVPLKANLIIDEMRSPD